MPDRTGAPRIGAASLRLKWDRSIYLMRFLASALSDFCTLYLGAPGPGSPRIGLRPWGGDPHSGTSDCMNPKYEIMRSQTWFCCNQKVLVILSGAKSKDLP